jgi:hypothetical protein
MKNSKILKGILILFGLPLTVLGSWRLFDFWGTSEIALRIESYIAIIVHCLVAILGYRLKIYCLSYKVLNVLSSSLVDTTPIKTNYKNVNELNSNQLLIGLI